MIRPAVRCFSIRPHGAATLGKDAGRGGSGVRRAKNWRPDTSWWDIVLLPALLGCDPRRARRKRVEELPCPNQDARQREKTAWPACCWHSSPLDHRDGLAIPTEAAAVKWSGVPLDSTSVHRLYIQRPRFNPESWWERKSRRGTRPDQNRGGQPGRSKGSNVIGLSDLRTSGVLVAPTPGSVGVPSFVGPRRTVGSMLEPCWAPASWRGLFSLICSTSRGGCTQIRSNCSRAFQKPSREPEGQCRRLHDGQRGSGPADADRVGCSARRFRGRSPHRGPPRARAGARPAGFGGRGRGAIQPP